MKITVSPKENSLLASLTAASYERLLPDIEPVYLRTGRNLTLPDDPMNHAYFPVDAIVSLLSAVTEGDETEIAMIGYEGVVGTPLFMGCISMPNRALIQHGGRALRISALRLNEEFSRHESLHVTLLRYTQTLMRQSDQIAACNRHHSTEQNLCRWLLMITDRIELQPLSVTQEWIANTLGVRRERIAKAAGNLQRLGIICYQRGHISVLDKVQLCRQCCNCYQSVQLVNDRSTRFQ